mgnify:CR=1 FL=1
METGWKKLDDGKYYYFGNEMKFNVWMKGTSDGKWYYVKEDGAMAANEVCADNTGKVYKFDSAGRMESGWKVLEDGEYHYFGNAMTFGWKQINSKWYYFDLDTGAMVHDEVRTIDGVTYIFASNGTYTKG